MDTNGHSCFRLNLLACNSPALLSLVSLQSMCVIEQLTPRNIYSPMYKHLCTITTDTVTRCFQYCTLKSSTSTVWTTFWAPLARMPGHDFSSHYVNKSLVLCTDYALWYKSMFYLMHTKKPYIISIFLNCNQGEIGSVTQDKRHIYIYIMMHMQLPWGRIRATSKTKNSNTVKLFFFF